MATSKSVFESGQIASLGLESSLRPVGNMGLVLEIMRVTLSSGTKDIYGAGNSNAGSDDLKVVQQVLSAVAFPLEDASSSNDDTIYCTMKTDEKTDDMITIAAPADKCFDVWVIGFPCEG